MQLETPILTIARRITESLRLERLVNLLAEEYRHRIQWIQARLNEMADEKGQVVKTDLEAVVYQHYLCSDTAVRRYLRTLEGARIISQNSVYLIVEEKRKAEKK